MAFVLPFLLDEPVYTLRARPSRLLEQHFGIGLDSEDFLQPVHLNQKEVTRTPAGYLRRWRSRNSSNDTGSTIVSDKDKFQANLDVQQFKPEEITIKITADNVLTIEGKHEEKEDEHGSISRHLVRRYVLPQYYDVSKIESKLSSDGLLTITAPAIEVKKIEHQTIPIAQTGEPARLQILEKEKLEPTK